MSRTLTNRSHYPFRTAIFAVLTCLFIALQISAMASNDLFQIYCPPDTTVTCDAEIWDLSIFGNAYYHDYNGYQSAGDPISEEYHLNDCGTGTIVRTWVAYDYHNNPHYCSQTIYIGGAGDIYIHWPPTYTIEDCDPMTDPEDLPPPYDMPVVDDSYAPCTQIMIGYEDQMFHINDGCKKILRHWTVIDWCQYDPNDSYPTGEWTYTQTIKIVPPDPPTITCPDDITMSADGSCDGAYVHIPPATGMSSCGGDVVITNHSPYADSNGPDASGYYPLGTTEVVFKVANDCGGYSYTSCSMTVTVKDLKAPTPVCYYGISVSLMPMGDGAMLDLRPDFFNNGSFDNCTPPDQLEFDIEPKQVTCADLGQIAVKVFVTDQSGNSAHCNTVAIVQDNQDACPPTNGLIQGAVYTPDGSVMGDVKVMLDGSARFDMTTEDGSYEFHSVPFGNSYRVMPERMKDDGEGITSMDLVVLLKHVLGIEPITDPYLQIAGDINLSGHVSVNDLIDLKDLILRGYYNVPVETEWRFVDAGHEFQPGEDVFTSAFPESYLIQDFDGDMTELNFIGVKIGDLSGDMNMPTSSGSRQAPQDFHLTAQIPDEIRRGEEFEVIIRNAEPNIDIQALQLMLSFDPTSIEFVDVQGLDLPGMDQSYINVENVANGAFGAVWFDTQPVSGDASVMTLRFKALDDILDDDVIQIKRKDMSSLAYDSSGQEYRISLSVISASARTVGSQEFRLGDAFPNPFSSYTTLPVTVELDGELLIEVFNESGQVVQAGQFPVNKGLNHIKLAGIETQGMLIVRVSNGELTNTTRIVSLKRE